MTQEVVCARVALKPDSTGRVRQWAAFISENRAEALKSLQAEGVTIESVFLDSNPSGDFLVYYMRSSSQSKAEAVAAKSISMIDAYHERFKKEAWARVDRLELLLDLELPEGAVRSHGRSA